VQGSGVTGDMEVSGVGTGVGPATGAFTFKGTLQLSGRPSEVEVDGEMSWSGVLAADGLEGEVNFSGPVHWTFFPTEASCNVVTGDLAVEARERQEAAGFAPTADGDFVAVRTGEGDPAAVVEEYADLAEDIAAALEAGGALTKQQLVELLERTVQLHNDIVHLNSCGPAPQGFPKGLADPYFSALYRDLVLTFLANEQSFDTYAILFTLVFSAEVGAWGASSPDPGKGLQLELQFVKVLNARVQEAAFLKDVKLLTSIYVTAQQMGLQVVANNAKAALEQLK